MTHILKAYIDALLVMVLGLFLVIATMSIEAKKSENDHKQIAMIEASIAWPQGDIDVDLWLNGPGQDRASGYSNKSGVTWDLLRDDMGMIADNFPMNYENGFVRNFSPGEYTINVHYYRDRANHGPVTVAVEIQIEVGNKKQVISRTVTLEGINDEQTAINFTVDADGTVSNLNQVYIPLRSEATTRQGGPE